jgi:hypothetical protein
MFAKLKPYLFDKSSWKKEVSTRFRAIPGISGFGISRHSKFCFMVSPGQQHHFYKEALLSALFPVVFGQEAQTREPAIVPWDVVRDLFPATITLRPDGLVSLEPNDVEDLWDRTSCLKIEEWGEIRLLLDE